MDILYPVKEYDHNPELRYSLRSLKNIPHGRVFFVGYKPDWVSDEVTLIPRKQNPYETKYLKTTENLILACQNEELSDDFILWNDDMYVVKPVETVPPAHRGTLNQMINWYYKRYSNSPYTAGLVRTFHRLQQLGIDEPLAYEVHIPMVVNKAKFLESLKISLELEGFGKRTIYGNLNKIGGSYMEDVKIIRNLQYIPDNPTFLSTNESSFERHKIGVVIRQMFPELCKYEKP